MSLMDFLANWTWPKVVALLIMLAFGVLYRSEVAALGRWVITLARAVVPGG